MINISTYHTPFVITLPAALGHKQQNAFDDPAMSADNTRRKVKEYLQSVDIRIWEAPYTCATAIRPLASHQQQ